MTSKNIWQDLKIPEEWKKDLDKNPYYEPEGGKGIVKSMKSLDNLYRKDGLVAENDKIEKTKGDKKVKSSDNCLWGLLLHAVSYEDEARQVVKSMKSLDNLYRKDGLVAESVKMDGTKGDKEVNSSDNCLWGLLLHAVSYEDEARQVVKSMKSSKLYKKNGVLAMGLKDKKLISSTDNSFWGLLLNKVGLEYEAKQVIESMRSYDKIYNDNGLLAACVKANGKLPDHPWLGKQTIISPDVNSIWGLLLNAVGYEDEAKQVASSIKSLDFYRNDGLVRSLFSHTSSYSNSLWGLVLQSVGYEDESIQVIDRMRSLDRLCRNDGLVRVDITCASVSSYSNSLWGLLNTKDGYKVFTGK